MGVLKTVKARRSVRKYKPESIPADKLEIIFEAARFALRSEIVNLGVSSKKNGRTNRKQSKISECRI